MRRRLALEPKPTEQDVIFKAKMASVKQLVKTLDLVEEEKGRLEKTDGELIRKHGAQNVEMAKWWGS